MPYRRLFFLVEGDDEERSIQAFLEPLFLSQYDHVQVWRYAQETPKKTRQLISSILAMGADYVFIRDYDGGPCVTARKEAVQNKYGGHIKAEKIQIVVREIESWYAAGINSDTAAELGVDALATTDDLVKEQFDRSMPKRFGSRIVFMREVLKRFDLETARRKNKSFAYFYRKYLQS
jgi:hypothetical protein